MRLGAIEAGGTKFVLAVGSENGEVLDRAVIDTTSPQETMQSVFAYFDANPVDAIGIGCFGPLDLNKSSNTYGYITTTPKAGWENFDIVGEIQRQFPSVKVELDTDVNAACLGEAHFGASKGYLNSLYLTVGTGIGGGAMAEGNLIHGMLHPEMGHIMVRPVDGDDYQGCCSYHGHCLEGMASGVSMEKRWGKKAYLLPAEHIAWCYEADYIAQGLCAYIMTISPEVIVLGGGVMKQTHLLPMIRKRVLEILNGYLITKQLTPETITDYIVLPGLGDNAGICGCFVLAKKALEQQ